MTFDRLNARKSLRKRTRPSDQHILPIISSLHEAQSQTQRGPGESTVRRGSSLGPSPGRPLNSDVVVGIGIVAAVLQESQLKDPSEPSASSNLHLSAAAAVRIRVRGFFHFSLRFGLASLCDGRCAHVVCSFHRSICGCLVVTSARSPAATDADATAAAVNVLHFTALFCIIAFCCVDRVKNRVERR